MARTCLSRVAASSPASGEEDQGPFKNEAGKEEGSREASGRHFDCQPANELNVFQANGWQRLRSLERLQTQFLDQLDECPTLGIGARIILIPGGSEQRLLAHRQRRLHGVLRSGGAADRQSRVAVWREENGRSPDRFSAPGVGGSSARSRRSRRRRCPDCAFCQDEKAPARKSSGTTALGRRLALDQPQAGGQLAYDLLAVRRDKARVIAVANLREEEMAAATALAQARAGLPGKRIDLFGPCDKPVAEVLTILLAALLRRPSRRTRRGPDCSYTAPRSPCVSRRTTDHSPPHPRSGRSLRRPTQPPSPACAARARPGPAGGRAACRGRTSGG